MLGWIITMTGHLPHLTTAMFSIVMTRKKNKIAVKKMRETARKMTAKWKAKKENTKPATMERTTTRWQTLIHKEKLQRLDEFQENVECLNYEGFGKVEAKR
jgi:hypothetical protein